MHILNPKFHSLLQKSLMYFMHQSPFLPQCTGLFGFSHAISNFSFNYFYSLTDLTCPSVKQPSPSI